METPPPTDEALVFAFNRKGFIRYLAFNAPMLGFTVIFAAMLGSSVVNHVLWMGLPIALPRWAQVIFEICFLTLILCAAWILYSLVAVAQQMRVTTPVLIVDKSGIHTRDAKGGIFLPWKGVARVDVYKAGYMTALGFWLAEPEIFLSRVSRPLAWLARKQIASGAPTLVLLPLSLGQKPADVLAQIQYYRVTYGVGQKVQIGPAPRIEMPLPPGTL